jgi:hypothetical protein
MPRSPTSKPRSLAPVPPSSFPSVLQLEASRNDRTGNRAESNSRRTSPTTNLKFEQALQAGGTVVIKEGIDFDSLGEGEPLTPSHKLLSSTPLSPLSPPTTVRSCSRPPDTSPNNMSSPTPPQFNTLTSPTSQPAAPASASTSASSSSNDLFYDAEDPDYQTKRRSMYRSQGTASSPDLATLVRKAKQRATILPSRKDKRPEAAPPLPAGRHAPSDPSSPRPRHRHRSSTSSGHTVPATTAQSNMPKGRLQKSRNAGPSSSADGVSTNVGNAGHDDGSVKASLEGISRAWRC